MIYRPMVQEGYEWINTEDPADYEVFLSFDGRSYAADWRPVRVRRVRMDARRACMASDFPWLGGHALIFRSTAVESLRDLLEASGEVLPLATSDGVELYVLNVTRILDAIDEQRSSIVRFAGTNRVMRIEKIAFVPSLVQDIDIFRLPHRSTPTYVSQQFVDRFNSAKLCGLEFLPVWPHSERATQSL